MLHICVGELVSLDSDCGLSPVRHQAITWTNAELLSIGPLGTNFGEIEIELRNFPWMKMHLNMSSAKRRSNGLCSRWVLCEPLHMLQCAKHSIAMSIVEWWCKFEGIFTSLSTRLTDRKPKLAPKVFYGVAIGRDHWSIHLANVQLFGKNSDCSRAITQ